MRDVKSVETKAAAEIDRSNVHIIHGDLDSYDILKVDSFVLPVCVRVGANQGPQKASEETARITGGGLDYLIANGAYLHESSGLLSFGDLAKDPMALEDELMRGCE